MLSFARHVGLVVPEDHSLPGTTYMASTHGGRRAKLGAVGPSVFTYDK